MTTGAFFDNKSLGIKSVSILRVLLLGVTIATGTTSTFAHDGGFGHSRRLIYVAPTADGLVLEYRLKQGLEEAIVELVHVDANRDGKISVAERDQYYKARGQALLDRITFRDARSGQALKAELAGFELQQSLVQIYRIRIASAAESVLLEDHNFPHKPGQVGIEVAAGLKAELPEEIDLTHADHVQVTLTRMPVSKPKPKRE